MNFSVTWNTISLGVLDIIGSKINLLCIVSVTGGVTSVVDVSKSALQTTSVPLYLAGMVSVSTRPPFSLIEPVMMSGNCPDKDPFTLQTIMASSDWWWHLNTAFVSDPIKMVIFEGFSENSMQTILA